jgi:hypothetical protein
MKRLYGAVAAAALLGASGAWAVKVGDNLYIKAKGVKLLKEAKATGAAIGKELNVGDEVKWKGPDAKDKTFHQVEVGGKSGFVLMSSLSPNKPSPEIPETGKPPMDAKAFASSGAATKALTPAGVTYAEGNVSKTAAAAEIIYAEQHNIAKGTPAAIATKAKELGGGK